MDDKALFTVLRCAECKSGILRNAGALHTPLELSKHLDGILPPRLPLPAALGHYDPIQEEHLSLPLDHQAEDIMAFPPTRVCRSAVWVCIQSRSILIELKEEARWVQPFRK